jgi:hypothetical protein
MAAHIARHAGPARVVVLGGDRHVFDHARDPRVVVLDEGADEAPDIVILPSATAAAYERGRAALTPQVVQRLRSGRAAFVLDASGEGPAFELQNAKAFHHLLRDLEVPARQVAYLTQNRDFAPAYAAWCGPGVTPMAVIAYDYWLSAFFKEHEADGARTYAERLARFEARAAEREKRFVCLNFSPRPSKVLLLLALVADGLWDEGYISFPGFDPAAHMRALTLSKTPRDLRERLPGLEAPVEALLPSLDDLAAKGATVFGMPSGHRQHAKGILGDKALEAYDDSWFTLVTETEAIGVRRVTEKPLKGLANFSPLVIWGNPGSLALLRGWDFQTFGAMVDESYDAEPDPAVRFGMLRDEVRRLCALPQAQLAGVEAMMTEVLAHNARRALVEMPRIYRDRLEPELLDRLLDLRREGAG